jgi:hypothetical protein
VKALPYIRILVQSLREHWLHLQRMRLWLQRLDAPRGRRSRQALILREDAAREAEQAETSFNEVRRELDALDVSSLDPARGLALIPLRLGDERVGFVFDLFAPRGLESWRFPTDSLAERRPLEPLDARLVDAVFSSGAWGISMSQPGAYGRRRRTRP